MENKLKDINKIIAVMAYARAASGLWSSLLDGHPNILTTPDCFIMNFSDFWKESGQLQLDELITAFIDKYNPIFDAREPCKCHGPHRNCGEYLGWTSMGPERDKFIYVDKEKFRTDVKELLGSEFPVSRKKFFQALHLAYTKGTGREISWPVFISFGLHIGVSNETRIEELLSDFPDTYFLQTIRNPISGFASCCRHHDQEHGLNYKDAVFQVKLAFDGGKPLIAPSDQWRAVRLEDIHSNPHETLKKVCSWLELPWNDSLLKSTWNGLQWWNEKNTKQVSGFSKKIVGQKYEKYISDFDRFRLSILMSDKLIAWNYKIPSWYSSIIGKIAVLPLLLFPLKMEFISVKKPVLKSLRIINTAYLVWKIMCMYGLVRVILFWNWVKLFLPKNNNVKLL